MKIGSFGDDSRDLRLFWHPNVPQNPPLDDGLLRMPEFHAGNTHEEQNHQFPLKFGVKFPGIFPPQLLPEINQTMAAQTPHVPMQDVPLIYK